MFDPLLPSYKQNAINGLSFGKVNKIFLRFPTKWWPNNCDGFSLVWNKNDSMNLSNEFPHGPTSVNLFAFFFITKRKQYTIFFLEWALLA